MRHSWKLFSRVVLAWDTYDNPVYLREAEHLPVWYEAVRWLTVASALRSVLILGGSLLWILLVLFINNLLMLLLPPLLLLAFAISLTLAPIVVQERLRQSWDTLLSTPYNLETILLSKVAGALWWLRHLTLTLGIVMVLVAAGVGVVSLVLIPADRLQGSGWVEPTLCGALLVIPVVATVLFLLDRIQYYLMWVTAALAASTATPSLRTALPAATSAVLLIWLAEVFVTASVLASYTGQSAFFYPGRLLALATLGPIPLYISDLNLGQTMVFGVLTLLVREVVSGGLWAWSLRRARLRPLA